LCSMAAFKAHCSFGFWKASLILPEGVQEADGAGSFGKLTALSDLPAKKELTAYIKKAMKLNEDGTPVPERVRPKTPRELVVPDYFTAALKKDKAAAKHFDTFPTGAKREYVDWLEEAKTEPTRVKRLATALEWIAEGKRRNWKYENC